MADDKGSKLSPPEVARRCRRAGLSLTDASAVYRLHANEDELVEILAEYASASEREPTSADVLARIPR